MNNLYLFENSFNKENLENNNQRKINKSNELDEIILCLERAVKDINSGQNKFYVIEGLENIILRLKQYSKNSRKIEKFQENSLESKRISLKPPSTGITTIELKKALREKYNYSPLKPQRNNNQTFSNYNQQSINTSIKSYISDKSEKKIRDNLKNSLCLNNTNMKKNGKSPKTSRYIGNKINGKKEGKGIYFYTNGCKYEGYFKNDKKNGVGIFYYNNGDKYEGNFEEGNYEGKGIFYFNNGDRYEGNFEKNKYSGKGKYYYHNGDIFDGYWMDDKKYGEGIYFYKNGDKIIGKYYNGKPYGIHIKHCIDGKNLQINY